jgi:hypothetical protein
MRHFDASKWQDAAPRCEAQRSPDSKVAETLHSLRSLRVGDAFLLRSCIQKPLTFALVAAQKMFGPSWQARPEIVTVDRPAPDKKLTRR